MIKPIKNYYQHYSNFSHILIICFVVIIVYGIHNINNLGLISDDWDTFRIVYLFQSKTFNDVYDFFMWQSGIGILQRPYWLLFLPFQMVLFKDKIVFYHLFTAFLFIFSSINFYISLIKVGLHKILSLCNYFVYFTSYPFF